MLPNHNVMRQTVLASPEYAAVYFAGNKIGQTCRSSLAQLVLMPNVLHECTAPRSAAAEHKGCVAPEACPLRGTGWGHATERHATAWRCDKNESQRNASQTYNTY
jgi:hypothetical protein